MFQKLSFALVLLTAVLFANGQVTRPGRCQKIELMPDFDLAAYTGVWYQYAKYPFFWEMGYKCSFARYRDGGNNTVVVHNEATSLLSGASYVIDGYAKVLGPGSLAVVFFKGDSETEPNYQVLGTDYKNYAVVYNCKNLLVGRTEFLYILTRAQIPSEEVLAEAMKIIEDNNISTDFIIKQEQDCPPVKA